MTYFPFSGAMELASMWQYCCFASSIYPIGCKLHWWSNPVWGEDQQLPMSLFWWGTSNLLNLRIMKMQLIPATFLIYRMRCEAGWGIYWEAQMPWWELYWSLHHLHPVQTPLQLPSMNQLASQCATVESFLQLLQETCTEEVCKDIVAATVKQSLSPTWKQHSIGRAADS